MGYDELYGSYDVIEIVQRMKKLRLCRTNVLKHYSLESIWCNTSRVKAEEEEKEENLHYVERIR